MVAPEYGYPLLVAHLERDEQRDRLDRVVAAVDVVAHEQVVGVGAAAAYPEQLHQVVELAVHVTTNGHRAFHLLHVRLLRQYLLSLRNRPLFVSFLINCTNLHH